jgi:hypothetical protein
MSGTSQINLEGGKMIVASTAIGTIKGYITTGYHAGAWNGNGIYSSTAKASGGKTGIGYATASSLGVGSFAGQSVNPTDALIRYTYFGDANLDGKVNALDFNALATNFGKTPGSDVWSQGDFNYDGSVNTSDFTAMAANFNASPLSSPTLGSLGSGELSRAVPEPATFALLFTLGMTGLAPRRTRPNCRAA